MAFAPLQPAPAPVLSVHADPNAVRASKSESKPFRVLEEDTSPTSTKFVQRLCAMIRSICAAENSGSSFLVLPSGSARLGVALPGSDVDLIAVGFGYDKEPAIDTDGMLAVLENALANYVVPGSLASLELEPDAGSKSRRGPSHVVPGSISYLRSAIPPLLKCSVAVAADGGQVQGQGQGQGAPAVAVDVDLQFVWAPANVSPLILERQMHKTKSFSDEQLLDLEDDRWLCVRSASLPSVQALRFPLAIERLLAPETPDKAEAAEAAERARQRFRTTLRAVRVWARARQLTGNSVGLLGGVSWAILAAFAVLHVDLRSGASRWSEWDGIRAFFYVFAHWHWPLPIALRMPHQRPALEWIETQQERPSRAWVPPHPAASVDGKYLVEAAAAQLRAANPLYKPPPFPLSSTAPESKSEPEPEPEHEPETKLDAKAKPASASASGFVGVKTAPAVTRTCPVLPPVSRARPTPVYKELVESSASRRFGVSAADGGPTPLPPTPPPPPTAIAMATDEKAGTKGTLGANAGANAGAADSKTSYHALVRSGHKEHYLARNAMPILMPCLLCTNTSFNVSTRGRERIARELARAWSLLADAAWTPASAARAWSEVCAPHVSALPLAVELRFVARAGVDRAAWTGRCVSVGWRLLQSMHLADAEIRVESLAVDEEKGTWRWAARVPEAKSGLDAFWINVVAEWLRAIPSVSDWLECKVVVAIGSRELTVPVPNTL